MTLAKKMSIRSKLLIGFLSVSMIPFLFVSTFSVVTFKNDKEKAILNSLKSELDAQTRLVEKYVTDLADSAKGLGFDNGTTRDALEKLFLNPPKQDDIMRSITASQNFAYFRQYLKGDVRRVMLIMNAKDKQGDIIGEIVYSIKKGAGKILEDSLELKSSLNESLYLQSTDSHPFAKAYQVPTQ